MINQKNYKVMGQYYKPVILKDNKKTVEAWVYSHDYGSGLKLMEHSYLANKFVNSFESLILNNPKRVVWAGDYADECKGRKSNLYYRSLDKNNVLPTTQVNKNESRYIINHSKKTLVDKNKVPKKDGWQVHPLPILTCEGNGRGGGDFRGDSNLLGTWSRDVISVESKKPKGFEETVFDI